MLDALQFKLHARVRLLLSFYVGQPSLHQAPLSLNTRHLATKLMRKHPMFSDGRAINKCLDGAGLLHWMIQGSVPHGLLLSLVLYLLVVIVELDAIVRAHGRGKELATRWLQGADHSVVIL